MTMMEMITEWIRLTNQQFVPDRHSCLKFKDQFEGYFPEAFLAKSYYVLVPQMPVPAYQFLEQHNLQDLFNRDLAGLTLNNTYYLLPSVENDLQVHFHELVHVAQWQHLGVEGFITRYLEELETWGYDRMPLERMAYELDGRYGMGSTSVKVLELVKRDLALNHPDR